jgi:hypothetical protein
MKFGSRLLCVFSILLLAACHGESGAPPSPGDTASTAPAPIVSTAVTTSIPLDNVPINNSAPVKIAFSVPGGGSATGLTVTTGLASLPSGWSGTSPSFSCATVDANNPCELTLTYNPTQAGASGALTLGFTYIDSRGKQQQGSVGIPYSSAAANSVTTSVVPPGPVAGVVGATNTMTVTFASSDGAAVGNLALVTNPASLPSGWSLQSAVLPCATVTGASACQLQLTYTPTAAATPGTLTLDFTYTDDAGAARTGSVAIGYSAATPATVTAAVTPFDANSTYVGSTAAVGVVFSATGGSASNLQITSTLPAGWSLAGGTVPCAQVSGASACQATLNYAPTATTAASTLALQYTYTDNFGASRTGQLSIPYSAVAHTAYVVNFLANTVTRCALNATGGLVGCTQANSPTITGPAGITLVGARAYIPLAGGAQGVTVCDIADSGLSGCRSAMTDTQEPVSVAFDNDVAFISNQGNSTIETCTVASDGTFSGCAVVAAATPFLSPGSGLAMYGSNLYSGNVGAANVTRCALTAGVVSTCTNDSVSALTANVAFAGTNAYLTVPAQNLVLRCSVGNGGALSGCADSGPGPIFDEPFGIALFGGYAYITNRVTNTVSQCAVGATGQLSGCVNTGINLMDPLGIAIQ